jgi:hypothetical protein
LAKFLPAVALAKVGFVPPEADLPPFHFGEASPPTLRFDEASRQGTLLKRVILIGNN